MTSLGTAYALTMKYAPIKIFVEIRGGEFDLEIQLDNNQSNLCPQMRPPTIAICQQSARNLTCTKLP